MVVHSTRRERDRQASNPEFTHLALNGVLILALLALAFELFVLDEGVDGSLQSNFDSLLDLFQ